MTDFAMLRQRMVDNQIRPSEVTDLGVIRAFQAVPREAFAAPAERPFAYADRELRMSDAAPERRMMEPVQLARLVHALPLGPQARVMTVGCGSGYSAAILSKLAGSVVAIEEDSGLAALARENLRSLGADNVTVVEAPLSAGDPAHGPYSAILLDGATEVTPETLITQLKPGGLLATIERGPRVSRAMLFERIGEEGTRWPQFDAWATTLPGYGRKPAFVF